MQEYFENYRENERVYCGDKGLTFVKFKPIGWPLVAATIGGYRT
jgi:hypothetical protein